MTTLSLWALRQVDPNGYRAPELWPFVLTGIVHGHPSQPDGKSIKSSPITAIVSLADCKVATSQTEYELGEPLPDFVAWRESQNLPIDMASLMKSVEAGVRHNISLQEYA